MLQPLGPAARFGLTGLPVFPALLTPNQSFPFNLTFSPQMPALKK